MNLPLLMVLSLRQMAVGPLIKIDLLKVNEAARKRFSSSLVFFYVFFVLKALIRVAVICCFPY